MNTVRYEYNIGNATLNDFCSINYQISQRIDYVHELIEILQLAAIVIFYFCRDRCLIILFENAK